MMMLFRTLVSLSLALNFFFVAANVTQAEIDFDVSKIEPWADKTFGQAQDEKRFSGAVVSVVHKGEVVFLKGYGFSDYQAKTPIDPRQTRVRVCSNTKIFVATALMQLYDERLIESLDDPANKYLRRIQLPQFEGADVSVLDLMKHRAGLEDSYFSAGTLVALETPVSAEVVERLIPNMVRRPGELAVYSNAAAALQGVLIEDVRGKPLREVLKEHIFDPLEMQHTTLNDGPPPPDGHAQPYVLFTDGTIRPKKIVAKHPVYAASGGIYSTAEDMARFVKAHLDAGRTAANPILSAESFATMHRTLTYNHPKLTGLAIQFYADRINGHQVLSHGCGLPGFTSYLGFLPESDLGIFLSVASASEQHNVLSNAKKCLFGEKDANQPSSVHPARAVKFFYGFLKTFVGFGNVPESLNLPTADLARYFGTYRMERRNHSSILAALDLVFPSHATIVVGPTEPNSLSFNGGSAYVPIAEHVFQKAEQANPLHRYAFHLDESGQAIRLLRSSAIAATRVSFWNNPRPMHTLLLWLAGAMLAGSTFVFFPAKCRAAQIAKWLPAATFACLLLISAVLFIGFEPDMGFEQYVNTGQTTRLYAIAAVCNAIAIIACLMLGFALLSWKQNYWGEKRWAVVRRIAYSLIALVSGCFLPLLFSFNLLGFQVS